MSQRVQRSGLTRRGFLALAGGALAAACGGSGGQTSGPAATAPASPDPASLPTAVPTPAPRPAPVATVSTGPRLSYVMGSSTKLEQLIGDFDKQLKQPTVTQTESKYGLVGTDLGNSFEHNDKAYFLFGDAAAPGAPDPIGFTQATDSDGKLGLLFISDRPKTFVPARPAGVNMGPFNVPIAGLSLDGAMYIVLKTDHSGDRATDRSFLTRFDEPSRAFTVLRDVSKLPGGRFIKMTLRLAPDGMKGLPAPGRWVLMFGSGEYRQSNAYLATVPAASFATGAGTQYFAGLNGTEPRWSNLEADSAPIVMHPTIGDLSVQYVPDLGLWLMTYDSRDPRGVLLRYATQPWGPWSDFVTIFNGDRDGALGKFIHDPRVKPDDGLGGPVTGGADPATVRGGEYAPYMIERFTRLQGNSLALHYVLSLWNPYTVVHMRSMLTVQR